LASYQNTAKDSRHAADALRGRPANAPNPIRTAARQGCELNPRTYIGLLARLSCAAAAFIALLILPAKGSEPPLAQTDPRCERKAACVHNMLYFIEWPHPAAAKTSITLGVLGMDPIRQSFALLEGRPTANDKNFRLVVFEKYDKNVDYSICDVLFVARSESAHLEEVVESLEDKPVLTIGDWPDFLRAGGMIELVQINKKIRWRINLRPVNKSGLQLSSQLLRNALDVVCVPLDENCPVRYEKNKQSLPMRPERGPAP